jgi:pyruvate,water dikinase
MVEDKSKAIILSFRDVHKEDVPLVGGKGANLGEMYNAGFPVPPGFFVTAYAYERFLEITGVKDEIKEVLKDLDVDDNDALQAAARKIQAIIETEEIPEEIARPIEKAYEGMYKSKYDLPKSVGMFINAVREPPFVAVRSSATAEDLPNASFAGQQATFLNVKGEKNVLDAVRKCWASLFTARAIFYREKNNFDHFKVKLCAVVQKMVDSTKSGVAFSVDPFSENRNIIVIEAGWGLGEAIVSGSINPDHYEVDKNSLKIVKKEIREKDFMIVRAPEGNNKKVYLDEPKRSSQVLSDDDIIELAKMIKRIEDHYGSPQDIEWAYEGKKLFIVQSRPITTLGKESKKEDEEKIEGIPILKGLPASKGVATGVVKIVHNPNELDKVSQGDILVTKMTDPDYVPAMKKAAAIVTDEGGMTSHAAIVSREMEIPCVVGTEKATQMLKDGDIITVDAFHGLVYRGKNTDAISSAKEVPKESSIESEANVKTKTKIYMNLGIPEKIDEYKHLPIDGIGLMRIEFVIADDIKIHPLYAIEQGKQEEYVEKLARAIEKVAAAIYPKPVVVRFSDFKTNEYENLEGGEKYEPKEDNPMIGWRGVSRYVSEKFEPAFRLECKAIKKVREKYDNVWVMLPFVRNTNEVIKVLSIMESEGLRRSGNFKVWMMAEVPSVAMIPEEFAKLPIDGASIGSNDLTQLVLGVDRDSETLGRMGYFDERNTAVLHAIKRIIDGFHKHGKTVSLCGQSVSVYPEIAEFLVNCGIDSVSVNPDAVSSVRKHVAEIESRLKYVEIAHEDEA